MNELKLFDKTRQTDITSTVFSDGMVVTAGDLANAMNYPIELMQTLVRAYFGCGVVCGFEVERYPSDDRSTFCVKVKPGTALDCHGHPLRLCEPEVIDLTPDPCACEPWPKRVCIAIRRDTVPEAPRGDGDGCDEGGQPTCSHRRQRELVRVKVFKTDDLPKTLCRRDHTSARSATKDPYQDEPAIDCECLKACPDCPCCGEAWVLLACIDYVLDDYGCLVGIKVDQSGRKYVKPIECLCPPKPMRERHSNAQERATTTATKSGGSKSGPKKRAAAKRKRPAKKTAKTARRAGQ